MARIQGIEAGLRPALFEAAPQPKRVRQENTAAMPEHCEICDGRLGWTRKTARAMAAIVEDQGIPLCHHCAVFFGYQNHSGHLNGVTSDNHEEAQKKIAAIVDTGYVMVLKPGTFGGSIRPRDFGRDGRHLQDCARWRNGARE